MSSNKSHSPFNVAGGIEACLQAQQRRHGLEIRCVPGLDVATGWGFQVPGESAEWWDRRKRCGATSEVGQWRGRGPWDTSWVTRMGPGPARSGKEQEKSQSCPLPLISQPPIGWCPSLASACPCPHGGAWRPGLGLPPRPALRTGWGGGKRPDPPPALATPAFNLCLCL